MKKYLKLILLSTIIVSLSQTTFSQKVWEKPWTKWDKDDVLKILSNSPWAYNYTDIDIAYQTNNLGNSTIAPVLHVVAPQIVVRLYSAQTIQRALLRSYQINQNYDAMTSEQKAKFDETTKGFLECPNCKNYYIVILMQPSGKNARNLVGNRFKDDKLENLKGKVYLTNEKDEKRELAQFAAPKSDDGSAVFYFER